jgi:hypothetical protein
MVGDQVDGTFVRRCIPPVPFTCILPQSVEISTSLMTADPGGCLRRL